MVYIFLAEGFEEMEGIIPFDYLKRAEIDVKTVGIGGKTITGAHGLSVNTDISDDEADFSALDGIVLPGGLSGAENLKNSKTVNDAVKFALDNDKIIAAICAAPGVVLSKTGALDGKKYTCYPGFEVSEGEYTAKSVETDGKLITADGPTSAMDFAERLCMALA